MRPDQVVGGFFALCLSPSAGGLALKPITALATAGYRDISQSILHTHSVKLDLADVHLTGMYLGNVYLIGVHLVSM